MQENCKGGIYRNSRFFDPQESIAVFLITALLTVIVWNMPIDSFGIEGLTIVQQRVIAIFVMAVMLWLTEAIRHGQPA